MLLIGQDRPLKVSGYGGVRYAHRVERLLTRIRLKEALYESGTAEECFVS